MGTHPTPLLFAGCLILASIGACSPSQQRPDAPPVVVETAASPALPRSELDELIASLPPIGAETFLEEEYEPLRPVPAKMKALIERGAVLTGDQWKRALVGVGALRVPARWPVGRPFAISMRETEWLEVTQIRMVPRIAGWNTATVGSLYTQTCGTAASWQEQEWLHQELGSLPVGRHELRFDVTIERGLEDNGVHGAVPDNAPQGVVWQGEMAFDVEIVESVEEAVPPAAGPELDRAVRESISLAFEDWPDGRTAILVVDPHSRPSGELAKVGLSLEIEIREGSHVHERLHMRPSIPGQAWERRIAFHSIPSIPLSLEDLMTSRKSWSVHVRGIPEEALLLWGADRHWSGEFDVSIDELIRRELSFGTKTRVSAR